MASGDLVLRENNAAKLHLPTAHMVLLLFQSNMKVNKNHPSIHFFRLAEARLLNVSKQRNLFTRVSEKHFS